MKSAFFEFNVATSALFTARGGLNATSHNIANASTKGYSRQYVEQRSSYPLTLYNGKGMYGTGSEIYGIGQHRDFYLDKKYWSQMSVLGEYSVKRTQLSLTGAIMDEMAGTGLNAQFNDFFNRLQDLTTTAGDNTYRTNLIQLSSSISTYFKNTYEAFHKQQRDVNEEISAVVQTVNSIGQQIRSLNIQIETFELDGSRANDLRDQRALLVDELSQYVNIDVQEVERNKEYEAGKWPDPEDRGRSQKVFIIQINGQEFVNGHDARSLECRERKVGATDILKNPEDAPGLYDLYWANSGSEFNIYHPSLKGELKALFDLRDGNSYSHLRDLTFDSYNVGTKELVMDMAAANRVDLSPSGGKIKVLDKSTGQYIDYTYESYSYDQATKKATFKIIEPATATAADFNSANHVFTVGETTPYKGIPYYISRLNNLARTFAKAINEGKYMDGNDIFGAGRGHLNGFNAEGINQKTLFFTYREYPTGEEARWGASGANFNIYNITANNFIVNSELIKEPSLLAASSEATVGIDNNDILMDFLTLRSNRKLFLEGNLNDYIIGMTGELGIDEKQAIKFDKNYTDVTKNVDNQRMSVSGVSLNEEMTEMIKYQQQYQAAAKLINIIDAIYDTTVNRLGSF